MDVKEEILEERIHNLNKLATRILDGIFDSVFLIPEYVCCIVLERGLQLLQSFVYYVSDCLRTNF